MPKFCVAFISKFDNNLEQYIVEATDWREALDKAKPGYIENITHCKTMEEAAAEAFNQEWNSTLLRFNLSYSKLGTGSSLGFE